MIAWIVQYVNLPGDFFRQLFVEVEIVLLLNNPAIPEQYKQILNFRRFILVYILTC